MQIKNLSAVRLRLFGEILPSPPKDGLPQCVLHKTFFEKESSELFISKEPLILDYVLGMSLLVIFGEGSEDIYYLDRAVKLYPGVRFSIVPLNKSCSVDFYINNEDSLQVLDSRPISVFRETSSDLKFECLYTFFYQECASNFYFRGERHDAYELVYVDRGQLHNLVGGNDVVLKQQQLMLIDRNEWHTQYSDLPVSFLTISFQAQNEALSMLAGKARPLNARQIELIRRMLGENTQETYAYDCIESLLKLLLVELLRDSQKAFTSLAAHLPATSHTENQIVDQLIQTISANIGTRLTLRQVADSAHISLTYMHRLFQTHLNMTPGKYITKIRMEECKVLLREGVLSMGEIANCMGFSSQQHFSRQFRSVCGMTPSEYVRSLR